MISDEFTIKCVIFCWNCGHEYEIELSTSVINPNYVPGSQDDRDDAWQAAECPVCHKGVSILIKE